MKFTIELSRDERYALLKGLWDQELKINIDLSELYAMNSEYTKIDILKLEEKRKFLRALQIKLEG